MLLQVLCRVEARGAHETAHTLRQWSGQVFHHGITLHPSALLFQQIAHGKSGPLGAAYDHRAEFVVKRRKLMQPWADYLDELRQGAKIVAFKAA